MSWSRTAPTLPAGSEWGDQKNTEYTANHYTLRSYNKIARMNGKQFALQITLRTAAGSYGDYKPGVTNWTLTVYINGVVADRWSGTLGDYAVYYTGEANAGDTIRLLVTADYLSSNNQSVTFTAPELLGNTVWVNVNGVWKEATVYVKANGAWTEAAAKIKSGGIWK